MVARPYPAPATAGYTPSLTGHTCMGRIFPDLDFASFLQLCQSRVRSEDGRGLGLAYCRTRDSLTMTFGGKEGNGLGLKEGR